MDTFTCITEIRGSIHLTQQASSDPVAALRDHIASLPSDDGAERLDVELQWLQRIISGMEEIDLLPVGKCKNT